MGDFHHNSRPGGRSFGNKRDFSHRNSERPALYKAICSNCGKECEVPFRPTGEKPVYCRDCFREMGGGEKRSGERNFPRPSFNQGNGGNTQQNEQLAALNVKLDKIISLLTSSITQKEPEMIMSEKQPTSEKKKSTTKV